MRISQEAIYQALYVESRGALERELVGCLRRTGFARPAGQVQASGVGARDARRAHQRASGSPFRTGPLRHLADVEAMNMNYVHR